jgi:hypothetical protein
MEAAGQPVSITLTDKYPNLESFHRLVNLGNPPIIYHSQSVDALEMPSHLEGMRTIFTGLHHFRPNEARKIIQHAVDQRAAIGIFDLSIPRPLGLLAAPLSPLVTFVLHFLLTPFVRPITLERIMWTYFIPVIPLITSWDGLASVLKVYTPEELKSLVDSIRNEEYTWEIGMRKTLIPGLHVNYLVGYPDI